MFSARHLFWVAALILSACGNDSAPQLDAPKPDRREPEPSLREYAPTPKSGPETNTSGHHLAFVRDAAFDGGYAYEIGVGQTGPYTTIARLLSNEATATAPDGGSIGYDASYQVKSLENIIEIDGEFHAHGGVDVSGDITLTADFGRGIIAGSAATDTPSGISFAGEIADGSITGTVAFRGMEGDLIGRANAEHVIGAFAGSGDAGVFAGGVSGVPVE
jgi:hypothetical protein